MNFITRKLHTAYSLMTKAKNWPEYYLDYLGVHKSPWILETSKYKMLLRPKSVDKWIVAENVFLDVYDFESLKNENFELMVDIGANIGSTAVMACNYFPNAKIISYEPDVENFKMLVKNLKLNNLTDRVEVNNSAVTLDPAEEIKLYKGNDYGSLSSTVVSQNYLLVKNTPLKGLEARVKGKALLKIDIEGGEIDIFTTEHLAFLRKFKVIIMEFHHFLPTHNKVKFEEFLLGSGFTFKSDELIYKIHTN